jgi:lysyl-tRNA synthetase class 2
VSPAREHWRSGASLERLRQRAALLARIRDFFAQRAVLEVDTPQLVRHAVTDANLHSAQVNWPASAAAPRYLHTSAEYAMKRLLAGGSGDIYQLCHVFRAEEQGPLHNAEFMMLEWYRVGWPCAQLMDEVDALLRALWPQAGAGLPAAQYLSYEQAFIGSVGCNPLTDSDATLAACARAQGFDDRLLMRCSRDEILDLMMGARIGPQLGQSGPLYLHRYPASQAALARLDPADPRVALRFELYLKGVELANGFEELADAALQRARFETDRELRRTRGLEMPASDEYLLAALAHGLPSCSGVALGVDRLLMLATGAARIEEVMAFTSEHA